MPPAVSPGRSALAARHFGLSTSSRIGWMPVARRGASGNPGRSRDARMHPGRKPKGLASSNRERYCRENSFIVAFWLKPPGRIIGGQDWRQCRIIPRFQSYICGRRNELFSRFKRAGRTNPSPSLIEASPVPPFASNSSLIIWAIEVAFTLSKTGPSCRFSPRVNAVRVTYLPWWARIAVS